MTRRLTEAIAGHTLVAQAIGAAAGHAQPRHRAADAGDDQRAGAGRLDAEGQLAGGLAEDQIARLQQQCWRRTAPTGQQAGLTDGAEGIDQAIAGEGVTRGGAVAGHVLGDPTGGEQTVDLVGRQSRMDRLHQRDHAGHVRSRHRSAVVVGVLLRFHQSRAQRAEHAIFGARETATEGFAGIAVLRWEQR